MFRGAGRSHRLSRRWAGSYTTLTTPRSLPYLIIGAVLLFVLATASMAPDCSTPRSVRFYGS